MLALGSAYCLSFMRMPWRGRLPLNPKHVITVMGLLRNIGLDDLVGDVAAAAIEVSPRLHMAPPKALPHMRKFGQQTIGAFAFHPLDEATDRDVRWDRDPHMDMVWRDVPVEDIDAGFLALFTDDGTDPFCDLIAQHLVAILGDLDDMEVDGKRRMGAMAIVTHVPQSTQNLLKLPPKGGGFAPYASR